MIVLDTNALSETLKAKPSEQFKSWLRFQRSTELFTTTISEAELLYGLALMPHGARRRSFESEVHSIFAYDMVDRVLPFDRAAAREYADIAASRRRAGRPVAQLDMQIAAIARSRGAAVATRNVADFADCGIEVIDPWSAATPR
jgi:predicted nucleic acid-binding protein